MTVNQNKTPSVQKRLANLMANYPSASDSDEEMKLCGAMDDKEFNLHRNYHNAIECLVHCESLIKNLQEQLTSRDDHIASLEDKIVRMSLELASAKAVEDEHQLLKRRVSSLSSSEHSLMETDEQDDGSECIVDFASSNAARRRRSRARPKPRPVLSRSFGAPRLCVEPEPSCSRLSLNSSWSGSGSNLADLATGPNASAQHVPRDPQATNADSGRAAPGALARGFSSRVMSWVSQDTNDSMNNSSKRSHSVRSMNALSFTPRRCERSPINSKMALSRQISLVEYPRRQPGPSRNNFASLIGLKRNGNDKANTWEETQEEVNFEGRTGKESSLSMNSGSSSRSCISGVVFPVSSDDCLQACGSDFKRGRNMSHSVTANEEWPSVQ